MRYGIIEFGRIVANHIQAVFKKDVKYITIFIFLIYMLAISSRAFLGTMWYDGKETVWVAEFDSIVLPTISIEYRGSIFPNSSDIARARNDFPILYDGVYSYDDLRANKLIRFSDEMWAPYYFPIYSVLSLPVKMMFEALHLPQDRCFIVTNVILIAVTFLFIIYKLQVSDISKLLIILSFVVSPLYYYVNLLSYEVCMFSLVTIGLGFYINQSYKTSAVILSVAGMINVAILAVCMVMIAEYILKLFRKHRSVKYEFIELVKYGICFIPAIIYPILQKYYIGNAVFSQFADFKWWFGRFLTYMFDPAIGFSSFTIAVIVFFLLIGFYVIRMIIQKIENWHKNKKCNYLSGRGGY